MKLVNNKDTIKEIRRKVVDFYGTGMQFNPAMMLDLVKAEKMTDEEIIKEASKLKIIDKRKN